MVALYKIAEDYRTLLTDEDIEDEALVMALDAVDAAFDRKALGTGAVILELKAEERALKDAIDRLSTRLRSVQSRRKFLAAYVLGHMQAVGKSKVEGVELKVSVQRHKPAVVILCNPDDIPDEYVTTRVIREPNKTAISKAIQGGLNVNWAALGPDQHIVIR